VFLVVTAVVWLVPLLWAVYTSLRSYSDTTTHGYLSIARALTFQNYSDAWSQSGLPMYFWNSILITVPAVLLTLVFSSFVAFFVARFDFRINLALLMLFTAGNLLPPAGHHHAAVPFVSADPVARLHESGRGRAVRLVLGCDRDPCRVPGRFCTFVFSNYMRTIPKEISEAALVDGASVWRQFWQIVLPLCRPAFAALATLESIWIYNDFFWALVLFSTGNKRPYHVRAGQFAGSVLHQPEPDRGRCPDDRRTHPDRVPGAATALHLRFDTGCQQGLAHRQSPHLT